MTTFIDLSHTLEDNVSGFKTKAETGIGTYLDSSFRHYPTKRDISRIRLEEVILPGLVVNVQHRAAFEAVDTEVLPSGERLSGKAVLFNFGWSKYWGTDQYQRHPFISTRLIESLVEAGVKLVGVDTAGIDDSRDVSCPGHAIFLNNEILIVQNLVHLNRLYGYPFRFFAVPVKGKRMAAMPVRAFAEVLISPPSGEVPDHFKRKIEVVPYDPDWPALFQVEAKKIAAVFGEACVAVHHIGSTAIPGIKAKPTLDILVEALDIERVDEFNPEMMKIGYRPQGEYGIPGRRFFAKGTGGRRTHHVHVFQTKNPEFQRHLDFRDYMIAHPEEAQAYSRLKERLAEKHPEDIEAYVAGKDGFIKKIEKKAQAWRRRL